MLGQGLIESGKFAEAIPPLEAYLKGQPDGEVADFALAHLARAQARARAARRGPRHGRDRWRNASRRARRCPPPGSGWPSRPCRPSNTTAPPSSSGSRSGAADPGLRQARSGLGWALLKQDRPQEAAAVFEGLLEETPRRPPRPRRRPRPGAGRWSRSSRPNRPWPPTRSSWSYAKTEAAGPAALGRARLLVEAKRPAEAAEAFAKVEAEYPAAEAADVLLAERGWALVDAGKPAEADAVFARLLKDFPDSPRAADARYNLAESAFAAKQYDKVAPLLAPVVAEGSKARPMLVQSSLYRLGRTQAEAKDWKAAGSTFARLAGDFPDGPYRREAAFWRSESAFQAGDAKSAESGFAALLAEPAAPGDPEGLVRTAKRRRAQAPGPARTLEGRASPRPTPTTPT